MDGSAYGRVLLDAKVLFELGRVIWQSKTSPMDADEKGHVPESLKCRPQGSSRVKGKVKTCVMTVLRTLTGTKFKLALRSVSVRAFLLPSFHLLTPRASFRLVQQASRSCWDSSLRRRPSLMRSRGWWQSVLCCSTQDRHTKDTF